MEKFPREVVCDILSRLPLKYVIQCICVCKSWLSIVRDPAFEELHFSRSESEPAILILAHHVIGVKEGEERKKKEVIGISYMKQERLALVPSEAAVANIVSSHSWSLVGTCRGLLCFASPSEVVMVCNPVTREHVLLPEPTPCPKPYRVMLAFGFSPIAKKYKVVRLVCPPPDRRPEIAAQVYTLGDAGSWRTVQGFHCAPRGRPVYASGAVHWLVHPHPDNYNNPPPPPPPPHHHHHHHHHHPYVQHLHAHQQIDHLGESILSFDLGSESILSFDLGNEAFEMVPHIRFGRESSLEELGKCVAVVDTSSTTLVEVSVLRDISPNCWQKEYILPVRKPRLLDRGSPRLICALEHDGVLLIWLQDSLLSYRRKGFLRRDLKLARFPTWLDWEICSGYRGSLVSLSHLSTGNGDHRSDDVSFVGDQELYAVSSEDVVGGREEARRCDNIVNCFHENGMMLD